MIWVFYKNISESDYVVQTPLPDWMTFAASRSVYINPQNCILKIPVGEIVRLPDWMLDFVAQSPHLQSVSEEEFLADARKSSNQEKKVRVKVEKEQDTPSVDGKWQIVDGQ